MIRGSNAMASPSVRPRTTLDLGEDLLVGEPGAFDRPCRARRHAVPHPLHNVRSTTDTLCSASNEIAE